MSRLLLSGNEAIALACEYADVFLATGYPGTPSTEIIETIQKKTSRIQTQWSINEKVALEVAIGSCFFGRRSLAAMKHVGLNVAADPLMTFSYTGVHAGCVIVSCDDPGMYSSQNEQDNRHYAKFAKIPMLEPSDSQEAFDFLIEAFEISERFDTPVLLRLTTRICHGKSILNLDLKQIHSKIQTTLKIPHHRDKLNPSPPLPYIKQEKHLMLPNISRKRHLFVEERLKKLSAYSSTSPMNVFEENERQDEQLIVTSGVSYQYVKEVFPKHSIFKIGLTYPQPNERITFYARDYRMVICIEELDPFIEENLCSSSAFLKTKIKLQKRPYAFYCGELSPTRVKNLISEVQSKTAFENTFTDTFKNPQTEAPTANLTAIVSLNPTTNDIEKQATGIYDVQTSSEALPNAPKLCSGCPHLTIANLLREMGVRVSGDIGCYTLAALEPFSSIDMVLDMGASIPMMTGAAMATQSQQSQKGNEAQRGQENLGQSDHSTDSPPIVSIIGDSTFLHSGMTGLLNAQKYHPNGVICLLDNSTTAMTGQQDHPGIDTSTVDTTSMSKTSPTKSTQSINYVQLVKALGVESVYTVDPYHYEQCKLIFKKAIEEDTLTFIIFSRGCALLTKHQHEQVIVRDNCVKCGECLAVGCPSITFDATLQRPKINTDTCIGCDICLPACDYDALKKTNDQSISFLAV